MRDWLGRLSLRSRLMAIGVTGLAVALAVGGVAMYAVLHYAIDHTLDSEAQATARQVEALVGSGQLPQPIPVSGAQIVQVVDARNRVLTASVNGDRLTSLLRPSEVARARAGATLSVPGSRAGVNGPLRVTADPADSPSGPVTVVVAQQVQDLLQGERLLRTILLVTFPLLLAVLALIAWFVIGRTLRPVHELRVGAVRISGEQREERLSVPVAADEIRALALTLNDMLDRLEAARARQRAFVADAAHELRSPLTSMRTQLEVARQLGEGGPLADDLLADVTRLSALVEDLLLLARADSGPSSTPEPLLVQPLLRELAERYAAARVPVVAEDGAPVAASAAPGDLDRVLSNLVDNAVRHATSRVSVGAAAEGPWTVLTVTDDGPGIAAQDRDRVFERFARLDDARDRDAGGTGLGLSIVRQLVGKAGGSVRLGDAGGAPGAPGLRVEVRLPKAQLGPRPAQVQA